LEVYLDHVKGERAGAVDRFGKDVIRVGRNAEFELCFDDLGVSYEHAELRLRDGDFWLVDRGSTNGSYVNEERAYNARLRDGDMVRFGKKGPVVRFRTRAGATDPAIVLGASRQGVAGEVTAPIDPVDDLIEAPRQKPLSEPLSDLPPIAPAPPVPEQGPRIKSKRVTVPSMPALVEERRSPAHGTPPVIAIQQPGQQPVAAPVPIAAPSSSGSDGSSGSALEARRAQERRISIAPRPARGIYVALGALSLVAVFSSSAAVMFWMEADRNARKSDDEHRHAQDIQHDFDEFRKQTSDQEHETQIQLLRKQDEAHGLIERLENTLEKERKEAKKSDRDSRQKIEDLQQELARAKGELAQIAASSTQRPGDNETWKRLQKRYEHSIVLIACCFNLKRKDGSVEPQTFFGSGFFVSKEGHIVTNKHVVEPWKFRPLAVHMAQEDLEVDMKSYVLAVWIAETRFVNGGGSLDLSTGYSTLNKTLERVRTARDNQVSVVNPEAKGPRSITIHHESSNEDLALIKAIGGPFDPIPLRRANEGRIESLDQVMILGFPAGAMILEKGIAKPSPSLGQVRKVEETIYVNGSMMPGNSGGPLVDTEGRVIGVATRVQSVGPDSLGICIKGEHVIDLYDSGSW
jgi:S1-C subfamily serine protease